jgi:hypothetical protein
VRGYYTYIKEHGEIFYFVDQFSSCPALANQCAERASVHHLNALLEDLKRKKVLKNFQNDNVISILFYPVKSIATKQCLGEMERAERLKEMIMIIQDALLL